jgi:OHCU decarboxylase
MRRTEKLTLAEVNGLSLEEFVRVLGGVFEASPWVAARAWEERPFAGVGELHRAMCKAVDGATLEEKETLIRAHPDLVGEAALRGSLTRESAQEQASAGLDRLSTEEIAQFARLNEAYRGRFGFPFVICVRENKKESILSGFANRIENSREEEIEVALSEIAKIARLRLGDVVSDE